MNNTPSLHPSSPSTTHGVLSGAARRLAVRWAAWGTAITLAACASVAPNTPQEQVTQRANARWKHMVAKEMDKAYAYTTPGFRALVSADAYRGRFGAAVIWLGAEVVRVNCPEPTKCDAVIRLDYKSTLGAKKDEKNSTHIDETWLLEEGQWWKFENIKGN